MKSTIYRAQRFDGWEHSRDKWRLANRFYRRVSRRVAKCLGVDPKRIRYDPYDNSIEVYGCDHGRRLTLAEIARIYETGVRTCWLNSDRQQVTYTRHLGNEGQVSATTRDAWRKCYPDTIVLGPGDKHITLAEWEALKDAEKVSVGSDPATT